MFEPRRRKAEFCPCGKSNKDGKFAPFKGYEDRGFCHACGKTFMPDRKYDDVKKFIQPPTPPPSYIDKELFKASLSLNKPISEIAKANKFIRFLIDFCGTQATQKLIGMYFLGTANHWQGANVFWQVDRLGHIRTGKVMLYDSDTGKRVKHPFDHITWAHKLIKNDLFNLQQCFFGEHQLEAGKHQQVAICESEKSAVIASIYFPQYVWLAAGGLNNLKPDRFRCLKGKRVTLVPDLGGYEVWCDKQKEIQRHFPEIEFTAVYDELEMIATDEQRKDKLDIADFLLPIDPAPHIDAFLKTC